MSANQGNQDNQDNQHNQIDQSKSFVPKQAEKVLILAVETSCDETSAAVIENGTIVRSNVVSSQMELHERFGGVVPEVASRKHVETITRILQQAVEQAGIRPNELDAIAVTQGPGLVGSLLVGMVAAKSLALALDIPLLSVHHIAGHIYANQLLEPIHYPMLAVIVSGGHTELIYCKEEGSYETIGRTRDDAVGEAYDKVARTMGLPYPGGPHIDKMAFDAIERGVEEHIFPRAWLENDSYDFSFSGLKSAVALAFQQAKQRNQTLDPFAVARGFQASVCDVIITKAMRAVKAFPVKQVVLAGGVAANRGLREGLQQTCEKATVKLVIPPFSLCTDNAAMIGAAADWKWRQAHAARLDMKAEPLFRLTEWANDEAVGHSNE